MESKSNPNPNTPFELRINFYNNKKLTKVLILIPGKRATMRLTDWHQVMDPLMTFNDIEYHKRRQTSNNTTTTKSKHHFNQSLKSILELASTTDRLLLDATGRHTMNPQSLWPNPCRTTHTSILTLLGMTSYWWWSTHKYTHCDGALLGFSISGRM